MLVTLVSMRWYSKLAQVYQNKSCITQESHLCNPTWCNSNYLQFSKTTHFSEKECFWRSMNIHRVLVFYETSSETCHCSKCNTDIFCPFPWDLISVLNLHIPIKYFVVLPFILHTYWVIFFSLYNCIECLNN